MKKVCIFFVLIISVLESSATPKDSDSTLPDSYGWLIFSNEEVIWVPANITEKIKPDEFFLTSQYSNGIMVSTLIKAPQYKAIAKLYNVRFGSKMIEWKISILAVKVKRHRSSIDEGSDILQWLFTKDNHEVSIKYQFAPNYYISDISVIRKSDKRKYKKIKKKIPVIQVLR